MWAPLHRRRACNRPQRVLIPHVSGSYYFWSKIFVYIELGLIVIFFSLFQLVGSTFRVVETINIVLVSQWRDFPRQTVFQHVLKMLRFWVCLLSPLRPLRCQLPSTEEALSLALVCFILGFVICIFPAGHSCHGDSQTENHPLMQLCLQPCSMFSSSLSSLALSDSNTTPVSKIFHSLGDGVAIQSDFIPAQTISCQSLVFTHIKYFRQLSYPTQS